MPALPALDSEALSYLAYESGGRARGVVVRRRLRLFERGELAVEHFGLHEVFASLGQTLAYEWALGLEVCELYSLVNEKALSITLLQRRGCGHGAAAERKALAN